MFRAGRDTADGQVGRTRGRARGVRVIAAVLGLLPLACGPDQDPPPSAAGSPDSVAEVPPPAIALRLVDMVPQPESRSPILDPSLLNAGGERLLLDEDPRASASWRPVTEGQGGEAGGGQDQGAAAPGPLPATLTADEPIWLRRVPLTQDRDLALCVVWTQDPRREGGQEEREEREGGEEGLEESEKAGEGAPPSRAPLSFVELESAAQAAPPALAELRPRVALGKARALGDGRYEAEVAVRVAPRSLSLALLLQAAGASVQVERVQLRTLSDAERLALSRVPRPGSTPFESPVSDRCLVGRYSLEGLLVPTDSRLEYALPGSGGAPAFLHTSYGVLRDEAGGEQRAVGFRVSVVGQGGERLVEEHAIEVGSGSEDDRGPVFRRLELGPLRQGDRLVLETALLESAHPVPDGRPVLTSAMVQAVFGHPVVRAGPPAHAHGLVLVSLDTVRADRVGCYGNAQGLTPTLDALAAESTRFDRATAHASFTLPSHASAFSGQYPSVHGMKRPGLHRDAGLTRLLAEEARAAGYRTVAFTGGGQLAPSFGMAEGFEIYEWRDSLLLGQFDDLERLLEQFQGEPVMLFLHTYAAHHYEPPREILDEVHPPCGSALHERDSLRDFVLLMRDREFDAQDRAHLAGVYDACVKFADRQCARALERLRRRGVLDRDPLIVFSDHGEELFDHGQVGHGFRAPFQEQVRVPLLIRPPGGGPPRSVDTVVELVDLMPTALELLGLPVPRLIQGQSLRPWLEGEGAAEGLAWSETPSGRYTALQGETWKAIRNQPPGSETAELHVFDLEADPAEQAPIPPEGALYREAVSRFESAAEALRSLLSQIETGVRSAAMTPEELRNLIEMGYLEFDSEVLDRDGGGTKAPEGSSPADDAAEGGRP